MNIWGHSVRFLGILINGIIGLGLLFCAYSPYLSPVKYPTLACAGLFLPFFLALNLFMLFFWLLVRRMNVVLPLLFFVAAWDAVWTYLPLNITKVESDDQGETLKLLTYNIMGMPAGKGERNQAESPIVDYLKQSGADIVCLQEFPVYNRSIRKQLSKTYPYIKTILLGGRNGLACLSKHPILTVRRIPYSSAYNGSMLLRIKAGKDTLTVMCNHLESNKLNVKDKETYQDLIHSPGKNKVEKEGKRLLHKLSDAVAIRAAQADTIAQVIRRDQARYQVVCGDFNDSPVSYTHRIVSAHLQDAYAEAGFGPGFSYNRDLIYFRIDHVFVSPSFKVLSCKVDRSISVSDHYPVWCLLEKKKEQ